MNIKPKYRHAILLFLMLVIIACFTLSYAVSIIAAFLLPGVYFLDSWINIKEKTRKLFRDKLVITYQLFFIAQVIGYFYSENSDIALRRIEIMLPLLFIPAVLSAEQLPKRLVEIVLAVTKFIIPITFILLLLYHLLILGKDLNTFVNFTIIEIVDVSQFYLAFILLLPVIECLRQIIVAKNLGLNIGLLLINFGIILLLGNKTTMLFLLVLGFYLVIDLFRNQSKKAWVLLLVFCSVIILATQLNIVKNRVNVFIKTTDFEFKKIATKNKFTITKNTVEHRVLIDYVALEAIKNSLSFGYGTGDYLQELYKGYDKINFKAGIYYRYNAHNQYLSEFLKTGVLGGILFIGLIVLLLKRINIKNLYSFTILFFAFACCFESYLFRQHGVLIMGFILPFIIYNTNKLIENN